MICLGRLLFILQEWLNISEGIMLPKFQAVRVLHPSIRQFMCPCPLKRYCKNKIAREGKRGGGGTTDEFSSLELIVVKTKELQNWLVMVSISFSFRPRNDDTIVLGLRFDIVFLIQGVWHVQCVCLTKFHLTFNFKSKVSCDVLKNKTKMNVNSHLHFLLNCHLNVAC